MILRFPTFEQLRPLIELARVEDMGRQNDDVTSRLMINANASAVAHVVQKEVGVVCGLPIVEMICKVYDEQLRVEIPAGIEASYGDQRRRVVGTIHGPLRTLLSAERIVLNFLQHLSGIASKTSHFVRRVAGTNARIYDTRKTLPGFRLLDKYAVVAGGGFNHRIGLYDGLLIKDNHLAHLPLTQITEFVQKAVDQSRSEDAQRLIEAEVDTLEQFVEVLKVKNLGLVLLDNMDCPSMKRAVDLRDRAGLKGKLELEASGGVNLETVRTIAETGVDRIAVGAITHSAGALDIGLDVQS